MHPRDDGADKPDFSSLRARVASEMDRGDYRVALREINTALLTDTFARWEERCELFYLAGLCCFEVGELDAAADFYKRGLNLTNESPDGDSSIFLHELSLVARRQGDVSGAIVLCQEAIRFRINHTTVKVRSGFVNYSDYDVTALIPSFLQLAVLKQETGDASGAILLLDLLRAHCHRSCQIEHLGKVLNELGLAHMAVGNDVRGVRRLVESIKVKVFCKDSRAVATTVANVRTLLLQRPQLLNNTSVRHLLAELR